MPVAIRPTQVCTLAHPSLAAQYDFRPRYGDDGEAGTVTVVHTHRHHREQYDLPADEARALYSRLLAKGYQRF